MNSILKNYIPVADMIAKTFGSCCEVVIHDLTKPENSVVYVSNNSVTNRKEGESFEHLVKQVLLNKNFANDFTANYCFDFHGKTVKSSSALIRNSKCDVVGMLCVNIDITQILGAKEILNSFAYIDNDEQSDEEDDEDIIQIIDKLIDNIVDSRKHRDNSRKQNLEIIQFMDQKGIFLVKGAIDKVAEKMNLSKVTIYGYLDEIRNKIKSVKS